MTGEAPERRARRRRTLPPTVPPTEETPSAGMRISDWERPQENSAGRVIVSPDHRSAPPIVTARAVVQANARGATLGTAYLGLGAGVICSIEAVYGLAIFGSNLSSYPTVAPVIASWVLFIIAFSTVSLSLATRGERFPTWMYGCYLAALAGVVALDFIAIWPLHDVSRFASSSVSAGFGLLLAITLRPPRQVLVAAVALLLSFVAMIWLTVPLSTPTLPTQVTLVSMVVLPSMLGLFVVQRFRRAVQLELDRVLVQSTVSAPRFAVGMLASEELARLDLAAEKLLDAVASGRTALPLSPRIASTAASLATELRLHLIEGRRETWLYHAITESVQLGKSATLVDRGSLAGLLDAAQRDGLLSAVWLLVADKKKKSGTTVELTLGPIPPATASAPGRTIVFPVVITTTGIRRNRVDPSTWSAIALVGPFTYETENSSVRVNIECTVDNPANQ